MPLLPMCVSSRAFIKPSLLNLVHTPSRYNKIAPAGALFVAWRFSAFVGNAPRAIRLALVNQQRPRLRVASLGWFALGHALLLHNKKPLTMAGANFGTALGTAITTLHTVAKVEYDRLIIITDEQVSDHIPNPAGKGYIINVASYQNGIGYGPWTRITGFSQAAWAHSLPQPR